MIKLKKNEKKWKTKKQQQHCFNEYDYVNGAIMNLTILLSYF
jgi:hypothetical protein